MLLSIQSEFKKWRGECTCSRMTCDSCSDAKIFSWAIILRITWKVGFDLLLFSVFRERLYSPGFYCFQKLDAVPIAFSTCSTASVPSHFHSHFDWQVQINVFNLVSDLVRPTRCSCFSWKTKRNTKTEWKQSERRGILVCVDSRAFRAFVFLEGEALGREPEKTLKLEHW